MKKYKIFYLIGLMIVISCAKDIVDLTGSIEGIVKDNISSEPLQDVSITLSPSGKSATTGNDGRYSFSELDAGNYSIEFTKVGYEANKKAVTVVAGKPMQVDVMLNKITNALIVNPTNLNFGDLETSKILFVSSLEQLGNIRYTIKADADWISLSKSDGNATSTGDKIIITIDRSKLSIGNYEKSITISSSYGEINIPVIVNQVERGIATLTTNTPENITETTLTIKGTIVRTGGLKIMSHGHCWAETEQPTIDDNKNNLGDTETVGDFTSTLTNLVAGKNYFIRAYAVNSKGIAYSEQVSVTMPFIEKPTVSTLAISNLTKDAVVLNGEIKDDGNGNIKEYGFYWGLTDKTEHKVKIDTVVDARFSYTLKSLETETAYYYKAYAINEKGESCGDLKTFISLDKNTIEGTPTVETRDATEITISSAMLNGVITDSGDSKIMQRGFYFGTSESSMTKRTINTTDSIILLNISGLTDGTEYYYRAFAANSKGESCGGVKTFTTLDGKMPIVVTNDATEISYEQAVLNGTITTLGDYEILECGFYYGTDEDAMTKIIGDRNANTISVAVNNLSTNTLYYYKTYVATQKEEVFGNIVAFSTLDESVVSPWDGTIASSFGGGSGTYIDPYLIKTPNQLAYMSVGGTNNAYYKLMYDLDLNNKPWKPIIKFNGTFDGNGKTISNLYIKAGQDDIGLFKTGSGFISNLTIEDINIQNTSNNTGALFGTFSGKIDNCHVKIGNGAIIGNENVGGMVGYASLNNIEEITNCTVTSKSAQASILGNATVGGIVGMFYDGGGLNKKYKPLTNCKVDAYIKGENNIGGLIGLISELYCYSLSIDNCSFDGTIDGISKIGGIIGNGNQKGLGYDSKLYLTSVKSKLNISAKEGYAGGLIGIYTWINVYVLSSYSNVDFINSSKYCGGLVGYIYSDYTEFNSSYSVVQFNEDVDKTTAGGFLGYFYDGKITVTDSYTNYTTSGGSSNRGIYQAKNSYQDCSNNEIIEYMQSSYSDYLSNWNLNNTYIWKGTVDGVSKSVVCPRLSWE